MGSVLVRVVVTTNERRMPISLKQLPYVNMTGSGSRDSLSSRLGAPRFIYLSFKHNKDWMGKLGLVLASNAAQVTLSVYRSKDKYRIMLRGSG